MGFPNFQKKRTLYYFLVGAFVLAAIAGLISLFFLYQSQKQTGEINYTIPGVPYFGISAHKGDRGLLGGDTSSGVASVLEYWNPGQNNFVDITRTFNLEVVTTGQSVRNVIDKLYGDKYIVSEERLSVNELKKYINSNSKTPLLFFFPTDVSQSKDIHYHPLTELIGIKESEKKVIVHSYWLGNNYEISFSDLEKGWEVMRPDERNAYLVVQPKNFSEKIAEINKRQIVQYPARPKVMMESENMFEWYALGRGASLGGMTDLAIEYFSKIKDDAKFQNDFPPYLKTMTYVSLAEAYLKKNDSDAAKKFANLAIELDHDLDKPIGDWPGFDIGVNKADSIGVASDPYRLLGDVYIMTKDFELAKENYQKALSIRPRSVNASQGLSLVEYGLMQKK